MRDFLIGIFTGAAIVISADYFTPLGGPSCCAIERDLQNHTIKIDTITVINKEDTIITYKFKRND